MQTISPLLSSRRGWLTALVVAACAALVASSARAQMITLTGLSADATVSADSTAGGFGDGGGTVGDLTGDVQAARSGNNYQSAVFVFQLPQLGNTTNPFTTASFSLTIRNTNSVDAFNGGLNRDLYGLGRRASPNVLGSDFYLGGGDTTDATSIQSGFITGNNTARFAGNVTRTTDTGGNTNLLGYLNAQYAGGAGAGSYVFLRVNLNGTNGNLDPLPLYSGDSATSMGFAPQINYSAVPEPSAWMAVAFGLVAVAVARRRSVRA